MEMAETMTFHGATPIFCVEDLRDAQALFEEYRRKGAKVRHPPTNYSWAYETQIDLDGNVLRTLVDSPGGP
jgi:hypothetical protein